MTADRMPDYWLDQDDLPDSWEIIEPQYGAGQEYNPQKDPILRLEHSDLDLWINVSRRDPHDGIPRDYVHFMLTIGLNIDSIDDLDTGEGPFPKYRGEDYTESQDSIERALYLANTAAKFFAHTFQDKYDETGDEMESVEYAQEQIGREHDLELA